MLLLVTLAALAALTAADSISTHIVNGQESSRGRKPYIISLQRGGGHICGAVLISPSYVITAAHCVDAAQASAYTFVCGLHDVINDVGQARQGLVTRLHPNWGPNDLGFPNDAAIVKVSQPFNIIPGVCETARLPQPSGKDYAGKESLIAGWGRKVGGGEVARFLKKAFIPTITNTVCGRDYDILGGLIRVINQCHICVKDPQGQIGSCNGDSGGPLTTPDFGTDNEKVVGLTSFGVSGCDTSYASVYTRVSCFVTWFQDMMRQLGD